MAAAPIEIPEDFFDCDGERPEEWPDNPDVRRAVEWMRGYIDKAEWKRRRLAAVRRVYDLIVNGVEPGTTGRFFDERDSFAYQLFLAEAYIDHVWNYDPVFGSRVVSVFAAIGRNLDLLLTVDGIGDRVTRMVGAERAQPNGPLFELLVAAAYLRAGEGCVLCRSSAAAHARTTWTSSSTDATTRSSASAWRSASSVTWSDREPGRSGGLRPPFLRASCAAPSPRWSSSSHWPMFRTII